MIGEEQQVATLILLDDPCIVIGGHRVAVPATSMRLLVLVALNNPRLDRRWAAGTLWPDGTESRAAGNLRSALWRLRLAGADLVENDHRTLWLQKGTVVDIRVLSDWARRVVSGHPAAGDLDVKLQRSDARDLLPGWFDDWVLIERERLRQRLLHALESLSEQLVCAGRYAEAIDVAEELVAREPLRESSQRRLVAAHLAEGNVNEALRVFDDYRRRLATELGVEPGVDLARLMRSTRRGR